MADDAKVVEIAGAAPLNTIYFLQPLFFPGY